MASREIKARRRLEADLLAGDVSHDEYAREDARISAGTSRYLRTGLIARASQGDVDAVVRLVIAFVVVLAVLAFIGGLAELAFEGYEVDD